MSARSVPDELVQAAADALYAEGRTPYGQRFRLLGDEADRFAVVALQAAFAKLPECEDVRVRLVNRLCICHDIPPGQRFGIRHFNSCPVADQGAAIFVALAREFGGQE